MSGRRVAVVVAIWLAGCGERRDALTSYIPPNTAAVAFADLARFRVTPLYAKLPVPDALHDATEVLAVTDGTNWAVAARGNFREPPAGATMLDPKTAALGSPNLVRAMASHPRGGQDLLAHAPSEAAAWIVTRGTATLPLPGNLANLNRLLHQADYTSVAVRGSELTATAQCATPEQARHLEGNVRALASLARFEALDVTSDGTTVRVRATIR